MKLKGIASRGTLALAAAAVLVVGSATPARAAVPAAPPAPTHDLDDRAHFLGSDAASRLADRLHAFRTRTGNQVVVSIFEALPSPSLEDFTVRTAQAWRIGQKGFDNGVVLFVFVKDRKLRLEVGYGLEAKIPDVIAKRILDDLMTPQLKSGHPDQAIDVGLDGIFAAIEGRPLPKPKAATTEIPGDVPIPPTEGVTDEAGLLKGADGRARVEKALEAFVKDSSCRLAVVILAGGPSDHSSSNIEGYYATRSFYRANPRPDGLSDDDYFKWLEAHPSGFLFAFVESFVPLDVRVAYYGSYSCVRPDDAHNHLPGPGAFATDPAGGLTHVLEVFGQLHAGTYVPPPPPPTLPPTAGDRVLTFVQGVNAFVQGVNAMTYYYVPFGWGVVLLMLSPFIALPVAIRRRKRDGGDFLVAWGIDSLRVFAFLVETGVETTLSSSGSSSSSSSGGGGGGSFGGGGASGGW